MMSLAAPFFQSLFPFVSVFPLPTSLSFHSETDSPQGYKGYAGSSSSAVMVNFSADMTEKRLNSKSFPPCAQHADGRLHSSLLAENVDTRLRSGRRGGSSGDPDRAKQVNALELGWWSWGQMRKKSFQGDFI